MPDLWDDDLLSIQLVSPIAILREQGDLLGQKTKNVITGEVALRERFGNFIVNFYLQSSVLDYSYNLFDIEYPIDFYPIEITLDSEVAKELNGDASIQKIKVSDETEFLQKLREILNSGRSKRIVRAILSQNDAVSGIGSSAETEEEMNNSY